MNNKKGCLLNLFLITGLLALALVVTYRYVFYARYLYFDDREVVFNWQESERSVWVKTDANSWTIEKNEPVDWTTYYRDRDYLYIFTSQNDSVTDRVCYIKIRSGYEWGSDFASWAGFGKSAQLKIVQKGKHATYLNVSKQTVSFSERGGTSSIQILTDGETWEVVECPKWITKKVSGETLVLKASKNNEKAPRNGVVNLKSDNLSSTITVSQGSCFANGHEWVDLGLPSGTLWATCNIGASSPEGYGNYYAWGETGTKSSYHWGTYKYANGDAHKLTKYCNISSWGNKGFVDNLTTLQACDDPAVQLWGGDWHIPDYVQWNELLSNTTNQWKTRNGVNGRLFTSKMNGQTLFLPAAGYRWDSRLQDVGSYGSYWSRSLSTNVPGGGLGLEFISEYCEVHYIGGRPGGHPVRPVRSVR